MLTTLRRAEYAELIVLFFVQGAALAMWFVPLSGVLEAHGLAGVRPLAFAAYSVAAFVSPLIFGAMSDRHASPVLVLRGLALATALSLTLVSLALRAGWPSGVVLGLIQLHALSSAPTWSVTSTIVFARLADAKKEFGPIRAMATLGWMGGCLLVSALGADRSALAGFGGAAVWLLVAGCTWCLPVLETPRAVVNLTWPQRFGLDALELLRQRDHRVVYLTTALFMIPLAGFYPYAPVHLRELGVERTSAWLSLGQITEVLAMLALGGVLGRWRLKWIFAGGLTLGVLRYALSALDHRTGLVAGIVLHGASFTLVLITAQIYLDQRIEAAWRARAQALMSLMNSGVGSLIGYLGTGGWFAYCTHDGRTAWPAFWLGLAATVAVVLAVFLLAYRGRGAGLGPARGGDSRRPEKP